MSQVNATAADGADRFRAVGLGKIDAGAEDSGAAGDDAVGVMYHEATAGDGSKRKML